MDMARIRRAMIAATSIAVTMVLLASCGTESGTDETTTTTATTTSTTADAPTTTDAAMAVTVAVADSELGAILVDAEGYTLYLFLPDEQGASVCTDECAATWPPVVGVATAGDGIDGSLLGVEMRGDGSAQITYDGWPLYWYSDDLTPGEVNGQGINDFWFAVSPSGTAVGMDEPETDVGSYDY